MSSNISTLEQAIKYKTKQAKPNPSEVVISLLELEKYYKKNNADYDLADLIGCWNLRFVTGTKKTRKKAGVVMGTGKFIPHWLKIQIIYENDSQSGANTGRVKNSVTLGFIKLSLSGPVKFIATRKILAFDFTSLNLNILGIKLYDGYIRGGLEAETKFKHQAIKEQAFFSYFLLQDNLIAARGKGGGLALWSRQE